jgi:diadenosine tetraphosphate (Ap4A) HIT family hydrolase
MVVIYETEDFEVEVYDNPHITRKDGGHIGIVPKKKVSKRQQFTPKQAIELMRLTLVVGQAMETALKRRGIPIGRINYQDNANWGVFKKGGPHQHIHLQGRAKNAKIQKYGQALYFPHINENPDFYKDNKPLNKTDIKEIQKEIKRLLKKKKYSDSAWSL